MISGLQMQTVAFGTFGQIWTANMRRPSLELTALVLVGQVTRCSRRHLRPGMAQTALWARLREWDGFRHDFSRGADGSPRQG